MFLVPETDVMVQFLAQETEFMAERNYIENMRNTRPPLVQILEFLNIKRKPFTEYEQLQPIQV
jgi:hypothetical protein